ncbi:MAG: FxsA family protein [Devosia sp.]
MGRILFAVFLIVPLIEIACFVLIGNAIGLWPTLAGVLLMAVAGSLILRWQGLALLNEIRSSMGRGQLPARALADAMMVAIAGVLLLLPGYFSDLIGILLLLPPVRTLLYRFLASRVQVVSTRGASYSYDQRRVADDTIELGDDEYRPR